MRLFVGIPLAPEASAGLARLVERIQREHKSAAVSLRWLPPDSWHITLQFLGNTDQAHYDCLKVSLGEVQAAQVPVRIGDLSAFERAGVLFAGVSTSAELISLAQGVIEATSRCGFVAEDRPFHPHITVARTKGSGNPMSGIGKQPQHQQFSRFVAREFLLYESRTEREGARYIVRARFPLMVA